MKKLIEAVILIFFAFTPLSLYAGGEDGNDDTSPAQAKPAISLTAENEWANSAALANQRFPQTLQDTQLSAEERRAIRRYTKTHYCWLINGALRKGVGLDGEAQTITDLVRSGLNKLPVYELPVVRSVIQYREYKPGDQIEEVGFSSSSKSTFPLYNYNVNIVIVNGKTGKDISNFSCFPGEEEVLFPPTTFKVLHVERYPGRNPELYVTFEEVGEHN